MSGRWRERERREREERERESKVLVGLNKGSRGKLEGLRFLRYS